LFERKPWNDSKVKDYFRLPYDLRADTSKMAEMDNRLRIGELAERSGVSTDTIRYYERIGLMAKAARTSAGYREYGESAISQVRLVQNALHFGFSLKQVGAFLGVRRAGGMPCQNVRAAGAKILEAIELRIAELTVSRESIFETLRLWDLRLSQTPEGQQARLLEALPPGPVRSPVDRGHLVGRRSGQPTESPNPDCQN
jgi:DNA-binding transcriptional MerR regulator